MPTGPDPVLFKGPKHILCGHFHKRQTMGNITYIGNAFPMDFGDVGDIKRGMAIITHKTHTLKFKNWDKCPTYMKFNLTELLDGSITIPPDARVKCVVDVPLTFEESTHLKDTYTNSHGLREFTITEGSDLDETLSTTVLTGTAATMGETVDELVVEMLSVIKNEHINSEKLIAIYKSITL